MSNNWIRKALVFVVIGLFFGTAIIAGISGTLKNEYKDIEHDDREIETISFPINANISGSQKMDQENLFTALCASLNNGSQNINDSYKKSNDKNEQSPRLDVTIFYEDFEGVWPGEWVCFDDDIRNGEDFWGKSNYRANAGSWSCYCAAVSDVPGQYYDNYMWAQMNRVVDLTGYSSVTLSYFYWLNSEAGYDYLKVGYYDGIWPNGDWVRPSSNSYSGDSGGWVLDFLDVPTTATIIGFLFESDQYLTDEGAYIDEINLTGIENQPPTCSLSADPNSGNAPLTVTFTMDASDPDGSITAWVLDVDGDGNADYSGAGNPPSTQQHTYMTPGSYSVMLMVGDNDGLTDYATETVNVGSGTQFPVADFAWMPLDPVEDETITFDGSSSYDPDGGTITLYEWDWNNDGTYDESHTNPTATHSWSNSGSYQVTLRITDDESETDTCTNTVNVGSGTQFPVADFAWMPLDPVEDETITFDGSSSYDPDGGTITLYEWDWNNDGTYDESHTNPTATHSWSNSGSYQVTLRITDDESETDTCTNTVNVGSGTQFPVADFAWMPLDPVEDETITFDGSSSYDPDGGTITLYEWDWNNDGTYDESHTNPTATHSWSNSGSYQVTLRITDDESETDTCTNTVNIEMGNQPPTAGFTIHRTNNPSIFNFDASSSVDPRPGHDYHNLLYRWDFNNDGIWDKVGGWTFAGNPTWSYSYSGQKTIVLEVSNPDGSDILMDIVYAFQYADISIHGANTNDFFFGYPSIGIPALYNFYSFETVKDVFTKVTFQIGGYTCTDTNPTGTSVDYWEGKLKMSDGRNGDKVIINGYSGDDIIWTKTINTHIVDLPEWYVTFLQLCEEVNVNHALDYSSWTMEVIPGEQLGFSFTDTNVPLDFVGGSYKLNAKIKYLSDSYIMDDSGTFSIRLVEASVPIANIKLGDYSDYSLHGRFQFSATATLSVWQDGFCLNGRLNLGGSLGVSFDIPIFSIPFLAEAGVTGGIDAGVGIGFDVGSIGTDGATFLPDRNTIEYLQINAHGGIYGELLWGLARLEGGLDASGKFELKIPTLERRVIMNGGIYAEGSALWGAYSKKWRSGLTYTGPWINNKERITMIPTSANTKSTITRNIDLLSLKNRSSDKDLPGGRGTYSLSANVGETASPKIVLIESGKGVAVWSDINSSDDGFQSDICWSVYDGTSWGTLLSTNSNSQCEFDPEIIVVDDGSSESVVLTYLVVDDIINMSTEMDAFYAEPQIHTAILNENDGWSFNGENLLVFGGTVNTMSLSSDSSGNVFLSYLKDTDSDPWESGIGTIYVVNGTIVDDVTGDYVDWSNPVVIESFDTMDIDYQPETGSVNENIGGVVYTRYNHILGLNETVILPTVSGIQGFSDEIIINQSDLGLSYTCAMVQDNNISVFWVENNSRICQTIVETDPILSNWVVGDTTVVYENISIVSLKAIGFDDAHYLLFQREKDYTPFILEKISDTVWGNLRQISLDEQFSLAQMDGDSNSICSQMIYLRDTNLGDWLIGRWRCNEGEGINVSDNSGCEHTGFFSGDVSWMDQINNSLDQIYGACVWFNDTDSYVEIPYDSSMVVSDELTVTCWINLSDNTGNTDILGLNGSWKIYQQDGNLGIKLWRSNGQTDQTDITTIPLDAWTFIGVTYNSGVLQVIIRPNGLDNTSVSFDLGDYSIVDSGKPMMMGGFDGCIDEVWLFDRDISMSEVDSIWFTPYPTLGSLHDVIVQKMPSFASISWTIQGKRTTSVNTEDTIEFTGNPSGFNFNWNFGDGTTDVGEIVSHQYNSAGCYRIICNATDPNTGVITPVIDFINVNDTTLPIFTGLSFAEGGDTNVSLSWSDAFDTSDFITYYGFMRNETGNFNFSVPIFSTRDNYFIVEDLEPNIPYFFIVRAFDAAGNNDSNMVMLSAIPSDNSAPLFDGITNLFNIDNSPGSVLLEWNASVDSSPPIIYNTYMATSTGDQDFNNPVNSTNITYTIINGLDLANETYYFVVRTADAFGNEDLNNVELNTTIEKIHPNADFSYSPSSPTTSDTIFYNDNSSDADGTITYWLWNFGDGNTSSQQNPTHMYLINGNYNVTLTVIDNDGASDSVTKQILVGTSSDNWPMFHHDLNHSGYSTSTAPETNTVLWTFPTSGGIINSFAVIEGKVYFGAGDNKMYCLNGSTGIEIWNYTAIDQVSTTPTVVNGKVYFGCVWKRLYCLDAETGAWIWDYATDHFLSSSPAFYNGKVYFGSMDNKLYCLDADDGSHIWNYSTGGQITKSAPAIAYGQVYIGSHDYKVYCLNADTGGWIWEYETDDIVRSSPAVGEGKIYVGSWDHKVYCLDAYTGAWIWEYEAGYWVDSSPAVAYGKVYFGAGDNKIYCLDAYTGTWIWEYLTGGQIESSPAVADGKVYIGSNDYRVYCLYAETGDWIWEYETGHVVPSSPAIAEGMVYIGSNDHNVYCFGDYTAPDTVYVDDDYNESTPGWQYGHFDVIQDGIDAVDENGTVYVYNGTYYENLIVNKTIDLIGEDRNTTIIDGSGSGDVVCVSVDWVNVSGFTVTNSGTTGDDAGIKLNSNNNTICGNIIVDNRYGIYLYSLTIAEYTGWHSAIAHGYNYNDWLNPENAYSSNNQYGEALGYSQAQDYYNFGFNIPFNADITGIEIKLEGTGDNDYVGKVICRVFHGGFALNETDYLEFPANNDAFHTVGGPDDDWHILDWIWEPEDFENNADMPFIVRLTTGAGWHTFRLDNIQAKIYYQIYSSQSDNSFIYHNNFVDNYQNAHDPFFNLWDNGYPSGGNYWDDYTGTDEDEDGIGDIPYDIPGGSNQDNYPFINLNGWLNQPPTSGFTYQPLDPTDLDIIQFTDTSIDIDGTISSWYWKFGDGNTSTLQNPTHQYIDNGTYQVNLTVMDDDYEYDSLNRLITVSNVPPEANFTYMPANSTTQDNIQFTDNSNDNDGSVVNWTWDLGDGNISYEQHISHQYADDGEYNVCLTVEDDDGANDTICKILTVYTIDVGINNSNIHNDDSRYIGNDMLSVSVTNYGDVGVNVTVDFLLEIENVSMPSGWEEVDSGSNGPYDLDPDVWIESFFDVYYDMEGEYRATFSLDTPLRKDRSSIDNDPSNDVHQAVFNVTRIPVVLTDVDDGDWNWSVVYTDSIEIHINLTDYDINPLENQSEQPKTVYLEYFDESIWKNITNSTLDDPNNLNTLLNFTFGVGVNETLDELPGTYSIRFRFDGDNRYLPTNHSGILTILNNPPVANYTYLPVNPTDLDVIVFTDTSYDLDGYIINWSWDFNDGNISYEQHPTHNYSDNNDFDVCLIVTDDDGATDTICIIISVQNIGPIADFTWSPLNPMNTTLIQFTDLSTDRSVTNWTWNFDDENTSYEQHPTHQYTIPSIYNVCLTVTDDDGNSTMICKDILVLGLDINQSGFNRGFPIRHTIDGDWGAAQNFTPTLDTLTSVDIYLRKFGTPEFNLTVELREDGAEGALLDTVVFTPGEVASSWTWLNVDFDDANVGAGSDVFIVLPPAPSGVTTSFGYEWGYAFGNQYDDGSFWFTRDGGGLWRDLPTMYEFVFRTYGYS